MKYTRVSIAERYNAGEKMNIIAFWEHTPHPNQITKACLSQWYDCHFEVDGIQYHTAEQYMMAQKAALMGDIPAYEAIMAAAHPKEYKALGRKVQHFDSELWDQKKYNLVLQGNLAKFSQNAELSAFLDSTGASVLVEGSPYDGIWGVKLSIDDTRINDPNAWQGENLLGFALMEARDVLRERNQSRTE